MKPNESEDALVERLERRRNRTVSDTLQVMFDFYAQVRFDDYVANESGDMLLYQWGTYDWGKGEHFELDLTRQFILPDEDEPFQLSMTLIFEPTDERLNLGRGSQWCVSVDGLHRFRDLVHQSAPYKLLCDVACPKVSIDYSQC
ncbi:MAG: hypothetical protein JXL80_11740 [Planctomycetes bacterium]|nr:hypothetical protein [Planctomycetota bacterium]